MIAMHATQMPPFLQRSLAVRSVQLPIARAACLWLWSAAKDTVERYLDSRRMNTALLSCRACYVHISTYKYTLPSYVCVTHAPLPIIRTRSLLLFFDGVRIQEGGTPEQRSVGSDTPVGLQTKLGKGDDLGYAEVGPGPPAGEYLEPLRDIDGHVTLAPARIRELRNNDQASSSSCAPRSGGSHWADRVHETPR